MQGFFPGLPQILHVPNSELQQLTKCEMQAGRGGVGPALGRRWRGEAGSPAGQTDRHLHAALLAGAGEGGPRARHPRAGAARSPSSSRIRAGRVSPSLERALNVSLFLS